jgi:uncharacterized protein YndB with AHSA1/START domain
MTPLFLRCAPGSDPIVVEGTFAASPERVFRAWTRPEEVRKWFGQQPDSLESAEIDLRVGGAWRFAFPASETHRDVLGGTYATVDPGRRLAFSWVHERTFPDGRFETTPESTVTVIFEPAGDGTLVRLTHAAIRAEDARKGVGQGWAASFGRISELVAA